MTLIMGTDEQGFVDREQVRLLVWFENGSAAIAGPAVDNLKWVAKTLYTIARQWTPQAPQDVPPMPVQDYVDDDWLDCTAKDVAVVLYNHHEIVVERDEIFPGSGLATHYLDVAGRRRHETDWVIDALESLAMSIEQRDGFDFVI